MGKYGEDKAQGVSTVTFRDLPGTATEAVS
jgi:hypothetical protein